MVAFRYSLNTSTIRTTPVLDKIRVASEAGFQGIELWYDDLDAWQSSGRTLAQLRQALDNADLVCSGRDSSQELVSVIGQ